MDSCRIQRPLTVFCFPVGYHGALVRSFHREFAALSKGWEVLVLWREPRLWCLHSVLAINSGEFAAAPKQTLTFAEPLFSEQGSVSRPHFNFYCLGKVETRRSCAAKNTFFYQVFLQWTSPWGARGSVCPNRFEVVFECLHVTEFFTLGGQLKHLIRLASTLNSCKFLLRASPPATKHR